MSTLLTARAVSKLWGDLLVLDRIDLDIHDGEFVALLGPSGSGKSTLLRIVTGLVPPSSGEVRYRGEPIVGPCPHTAMVFQTFALYPWLTVLENVEIGLKAAGLPKRERQEKARRLIEQVGLDGFEDAYPRELSGGMRQRVGFARALAVEPELLCMDEPFSALDVLTAENLRSELLDLWVERKIPTRSILMVTHGVDEAVFMADRIVVLSRNPARVVADLPVRLPRPRNRRAPAFLALVDRVYKIVSEAAEPERGKAAAVAVGARTAAAGVAWVPNGVAEPPAERSATVPAPSGTGRRRRFAPLPDAPIGMLTGLVELLADRGGRDDLYHLGSELLLEVDELFPVTEAAELLQLAEVREGDVVLTDLGMRFAEADAPERKALFAAQVGRLPVFALIRRVLEGKRHHTAPREFFRALLADELGEVQADAQLNIAVDWGRYAELFAYDPASEEFYLEEEEEAARPGDGGAPQEPPPGAATPAP
jgi:NitT/TauT family transport system ATP-binding protein